MPQAFDPAANIFKNTSANRLFSTEKRLFGVGRSETRARENHRLRPKASTLMGDWR
jgi:hypothetical protein